MIEKKYMTASEFLGKFNIFGFHNRQIFDKNAEIDDEESEKLIAIRQKGFEELDACFKNVDLLKDKINNQINFVEKYNKQTMFGATLMNKEGYVYPSLNKYALNKDEQKGYIKAMKEILELLK